MKIARFLFSLTTLTVLTSAQRSRKPGQCSTKEKCPSSATCVSVQSEKNGLERASQCALDPVCGGNKPGGCPTFSSWPPAYRKIQAICSFLDPENCAAPGESANEDEETVECYEMSVKNSNSSVSITGIYKCVTLDLFDNSDFPSAEREKAKKSCSGNSSDSLLCNGQGTCSPKTQFGLDFQCKCNRGFSSSDNCFEPTTNECDNFGQCGEGGQCNLSTKQCDCNEGISGNQCSSCENDAACNDGKCTDGKCVCDSGFTGTFCKRRLPGSVASTIQPLASIAILFYICMLLN